ncbi:hypothetical protein DRO69_13710 [Candidatus Bathyarchaeota archaeon]|nr:MAG: hypothetical protein DRO69_13710 [Candidatus Bathyarchaeota archaeon]
MEKFHAADIKVRAHIATFVDPWQTKAHPDRVAVMKDGLPAVPGKGFERGYPTMCPVRPEHREYIYSIVNEISSRYDVDGIDLDYVRFAYKAPDKYTCYCDYCRGHFKEDVGLDPVEIDYGTEEWAKWVDWRASKITSFVEKNTSILKSNRPDATLQAYIAPWWSTSSEREELYKIKERFGQDIKALSTKLDVFAPMLYHKYISDPDLKIDMKAGWVANMTRWFVEAGRPAQVWATTQCVKDDPAETREAMREAYNGGADGVIVFGIRIENMDDQWEQVKSVFKRVSEVEG